MEELFQRYFHLNRYKQLWVCILKHFLDLYVTFHEQQECVYDFPSLSLATRASADVSELVFKQEWLRKASATNQEPS